PFCGRSPGGSISACGSKSSVRAFRSPARIASSSLLSRLFAPVSLSAAAATSVTPRQTTPALFLISAPLVDPSALSAPDSRGPPVPSTGKAEQSGPQNQPDDGRIDQDGAGQRESEHLNGKKAPERERPEDHDHDRGGAGDDSRSP